MLKFHSALLRQSHLRGRVPARFYRSRSLRPIKDETSAPVVSEPEPAPESLTEYFLVGSSNFGQLGDGDSATFYTPTKIPALEQLKVDRVVVASTAPHSFAITDGGSSLYAWGFNQAGQLGLGHREFVNTPQLVKTFQGQKVLDVFCGPIQTFVKTRNPRLGTNTVWHMGSGYGDPSTPHKKFTRHTPFPMKLPFHDYFREDIDVVKVAPATSFCLFLDDQKRLYSFGTSDHGALGHGQTTGIKSLSAIPSPEAIPFFEEMKIVDMQVGWNFALALNDKNDVYAWGANNHGQCGFGLRTEAYFEPRKINFFNNIDVVEIACGSDHCLARDSNGKVYVWGKVNDGRLGVETEVDLIEPVPIESLDFVKIKRVSAGYAHSAALSEEGDIWLWGSGAAGQLSQVAAGRDAWNPMSIPRPRFGADEYNKSAGEKFVKHGRHRIPLGKFTDIVYHHQPVDIQCGPTLTCIKIESKLKENAAELINEKFPATPEELAAVEASDDEMDDLEMSEEFEELEDPTDGQEDIEATIKKELEKAGLDKEPKI